MSWVTLVTFPLTNDTATVDYTQARVTKTPGSNASILDIREVKDGYLTKEGVSLHTPEAKFLQDSLASCSPVTFKFRNRMFTLSKEPNGVTLILDRGSENQTAQQRIFLQKAEVAQLKAQMPALMRAMTSQVADTTEVV